MTKPYLSNSVSICETKIQDENGLLVKTTEKERKVIRSDNASESPLPKFSNVLKRVDL